MDLMEFQEKVETIVGNTPGLYLNIPVTIHTGGDSWEDIVDIVFCQECAQYHIISEKSHVWVKDGV
jgi:hypothetical protein